MKIVMNFFYQCFLSLVNIFYTIPSRLIDRIFGHEPEPISYSEIVLDIARSLCILALAYVTGFYGVIVAAWIALIILVLEGYHKLKQTETQIGALS